MTWRSQTSRMFDRAREDVRDIAEIFVDNVVEQIVKETPGPGNQYPMTEYIATGRLRGGWRGGEVAPARATQSEGGPYDEDGDATVASVMAQFQLDGAFMIWNQVAYFTWVAHGIETHSHIGPRNPITWAMNDRFKHFESAVSAVGRVR